MAGTTTGLEPATSAVTVLRRRKHLSTTNECKRHAEIMFVRLWPLSSVHYLFPSNLESASRNGKGCQGYDTSHNTNPKGSELSRGTRPGGIWMHLPVPGSEKIKNGAGSGKDICFGSSAQDRSAYSGCFAMYSCTEGQITSTFIRLVALLKARLIWTT
jgi:hypothetical protein